MPPRTINIRQLLPPPVQARHSEYSMVLSLDDDPNEPSARLLDVSLAAIAAARRISLTELSMRLAKAPYYPDIWPGEHYRLLAGFVQSLQPRVIIEVGTATGLSALAMRRFLPNGGKLYTYDLIPWNQYPDAVLTEADFADGALVQRVMNLCEPSIFSQESSTIRSASLLFIDAAKDVKTEQALIASLASLKFATPPIVIFDDTRLWTMLGLWRSIPFPKLDLTSFGHWSGTGVVDWSRR